MSLDTLKSRWSSVTPLFFDLYDQFEVEHQEAMGLLTYMHDNRQARENPVQLDYLVHLPVASGWIDESIIQHPLDNLEWTVPLEGHQVVSPINRLNIDRPNTVATLQGIVASQPEALNRREKQLIMEVFRKNPLCMDGQNFFSAAHPFPGNNGTYTNILQPVFGIGALLAPQLEVLADLVMAVITHFGTILSLQAEVIDDAKLKAGLLVIVHSAELQTLFRNLQAFDKIPVAGGGTEKQNPAKGLFSLWRDNKPTAGEEHYIEFVMTNSQAKPAVYVLDTDPEPIVLDENKAGNGYYAVGFQKIFAVKPLIPNTTIQARPLEEAV